MPVEVRIDKERKCVVIELPMEKARPSASGKTTLIATSHGLASGTAVYSGRPVMVAASAFVYPAQSLEVKERRSGAPPHGTSDLTNTQPHRGKRGRTTTDKSDFTKRVKS
jgi:hypothetical protein